MSSEWVLGIDPGLTGALALSNGKRVIIEDMPLKKSKTKKQVCAKSIVHFITQFDDSEKEIRKVFIERVHSMPSDGVVSAFKFGESYGRLCAAVEILQRPTFAVSPAVWKGALGLDSTKAKSLELARKIFPDDAHYFKFKKHDGRAEAALIAHFALTNRWE